VNEKLESPHVVSYNDGESADARTVAAAFKAARKKLDMGKCCVNFESPDDLPLEAIGKLISAISSEQWIEMYEQSRLKTKSGQKVKQGAPSASKVAANAPTQSVGGKQNRFGGMRNGVTVAN